MFFFLAELVEFLEKHGLSDYFMIFLKEDVFLDTLACVDVNNDSDSHMLNTLLDRLKIDQMGAKIRLKKAIGQLKEEYSKKDFEARLRKAQRYVWRGR